MASSLNYDEKIIICPLPNNIAQADAYLTITSQAIDFMESEAAEECQLTASVIEEKHLSEGMSR